LTVSLRESEEKVTSLTSDLNKAAADKVQLMRQVKNQVDVNDAMRQALASQLRITAPVPPAGMPTSIASSSPLPLANQSPILVL